MAAWGYTDDLAGGASKLPVGVGIDGRGGRQPRWVGPGRAPPPLAHMPALANALS